MFKKKAKTKSKIFSSWVRKEERGRNGESESTEFAEEEEAKTGKRPGQEVLTFDTLSWKTCNLLSLPKKKVREQSMIGV